MIKPMAKVVFKQPTNRVSQDVGVEGDVEAVAVAGEMIAAPKKTLALTIMKSCLATGGILMGSATNGMVRLLRPPQILNRKLPPKTDLGKGRMLIPKNEPLNRMQVLVLAAVEKMIRRNHEQMIVHHAVAVAAVVVDGEPEMAKMLVMKASGLTKRAAKNQTK